MWESILAGAMGPFMPGQGPAQPQPGLRFDGPQQMGPRSPMMAGQFGQRPQFAGLMGGGMMGRPGMPGRMQAMAPRQMPGSAGLFDQYMQGGFAQRYTPQPMGNYRSFGGYMGFGGPKMPTLPQAQVPPWVQQVIGGGLAGSGGGGPGAGIGNGPDGSGDGTGANGPGSAVGAGPDGNGSVGVW